MKYSKSITAGLALTLLAIDCQARFIEVDFDVTFWDSTQTTASAVFDVDATSPGGAGYWGDELQSMSTYFGAPIISSPFLSSLPMPTDPENWIKSDYSVSLATNIDYSVSWPETPLGTGPFVTYQLNQGWNAQKDGLTWNYIVGFNLGRPEFQAPDIRLLTGDEILDYISRSVEERRWFQTGFNSRVYDNRTYEVLYGASHLGTAIITGYRVVSPVPEPATYVLFGFGLAGLGLSRRRNQSST